MIIDCHAHVFENWHGPCGHPSIDVHLKYIQKNLTRPAAETFRVRDGKRIKPGLLFREGDNTWVGLRDVGFRVGRYGRLEFVHEGEEYAIQYMPVGMQTIEAPPEFMIAQMDYAGVDHCILQAGGGYGAMNDYNAFAQKAFPKRFTGLFQIDEAIADRNEMLAEADRAHALGLKGLYYSHDFSRHGYARNLDHAAFSPFWDRIAQWNFPAFVELSATPAYDRTSYIANLMALDRLMQRHKETRFVLVMGPPVAHFAGSGGWDFPEEVLAAYRRDNLMIEIMFPITWGGVWDYPYPEAQALIRQMRDLFGAAKLVWGSDMPNVERFCTYRQCVDYVRRYCPFLSATEKDAILGGNVAQLFGIPT
ncbi:MAG TPA: amidohydrolase family protein [Xanthobacteraceae bacterium]|nr:amidohydrolase family protein [Xanthobacteraceae bacterium]